VEAETLGLRLREKYICILRYDYDFDGTWSFARSVIKGNLESIDTRTHIMFGLKF
jgi:hypothetical protein